MGGERRARSAPRQHPHVALVVAVARNGVIGKDGRLPWHLPEDLKRFRALTMGHHLIMGRQTWESIGRPLPGRTSVVLTTRRDYVAPGAQVVHSLEQALAACPADDEIFIIGGAQVYRAGLPLADRIYLTEIDADYEGDVVFPALDRADWREISRERLAGSPPADLVVLERAARPQG